MNIQEKHIRNVMRQLQSCYNKLAELLPEENPQLHYKSVFEDENYKNILQIVRDVFGSDPLKDDQTRETVFSRHALRYLLRFKTPRSFKSIGTLTLLAGHTTVINSIKIAKNMIETDRNYADMINECIKRIEQ